MLCDAVCPPHPIHPPRCSFELSDSTVKGEGELKIHSRLLHPSAGGAARAAAASSAAGAEETHLVLGADSDLLLMALVAGQVRGGAA